MYTSSLIEYDERRAVFLAAHVFYARKGYSVFVPLKYDDAASFVIDNGLEIKKVAVKIAEIKDKSQDGSWCISVTSKNPFGKDIPVHDHISLQHKVDVFLAYIPVSGFIEINGDFFQGCNSKSRRIPRSMIAQAERITI